MINGINAVLLNTNQFDSMIDFYKNVIGIPLSIADHGTGKHAEIEFGDVHFSIMQSDSNPHESRGISISFHVDDVQAEYERVKQKKN